MLFLILNLGEEERSTDYGHFEAYIPGKPSIKAARRKEIHEGVWECSGRNVGRKPRRSTVIKIKGERILNKIRMANSATCYKKVKK